MGAGQQIGTLMTAFMKLVTLKKVKKLQILQRVIIQTWSCPLHIAKVYYIGGYRKYDFLFLPTPFIIKVLA